MPDKQIPWVIGVLFAIVLTGAFTFANYMQQRIDTTYGLITQLTDKVARMEEREKSLVLRIANLERMFEVFPR